MRTKEENLKLREWLKPLLKEQIVTVEFKKKDGSIRIMECTLNEAWLPESDSNSQTNIDTPENTDIIKVFDVEIDEWRSFRIDSINKISLNLGDDDE